MRGAVTEGPFLRSVRNSGLLFGGDRDALQKNCGTVDKRSRVTPQVASRVFPRSLVRQPGRGAAVSCKIDGGNRPIAFDRGKKIRQKRRSDLGYWCERRAISLA